MRIVVVEDEDRIRVGLVKLLKKISPDYDVVGEAEDGTMGFRMISSLKPDLVITDIKMPEMDGIEMLMRLKENGYRHKSIILSGYSDFDYAKKAIKAGICEYLLKPVTANDLEQVLELVKKEISLDKMLENGQPLVLSSLEYILRDIVVNNFNDDPELSSYLRDVYGIDVKGNFTAVSIYMGAEFDNAKSGVMQKITSFLDRQGFRHCLFDLAVHSELVILIYNYKDKKELEKYFQNVIIKNIQGEGIHSCVFGMISFEDLCELKNSLQTLRKELKWSIVLGEDVLISFPKTQQINTKIIQYPIDLESNAKAAVYSFDITRINKCFMEFLSWWRKDIYRPSGVIEAFVRFASSIINVIKETNYELFDMLNQKEALQKIMDSTTWEELKQALNEVLQKISMCEKKNTGVYSLVIKKTLSFVDEFYKDGITLEETASRLGITPEYLGTLFFKEIGINFSVYMKEYRIKKAKELLVGSSLKTYEIAKKVGYSDPKYFSRVFKDAIGLTPGEYQKTFK